MKTWQTSHWTVNTWQARLRWHLRDRDFETSSHMAEAETFVSVVSCSRLRQDFFNVALVVKTKTKD